MGCGKALGAVKLLALHLIQKFLDEHPPPVHSSITGQTRGVTGASSGVSGASFEEAALKRRVERSTTSESTSSSASVSTATSMASSASGVIRQGLASLAVVKTKPDVLFMAALMKIDRQRDMRALLVMTQMYQDPDMKLHLDNITAEALASGSSLADSYEMLSFYVSMMTEFQDRLDENPRTAAEKKSDRAHRSDYFMRVAGATQASLALPTDESTSTSASSSSSSSAATGRVTAVRRKAKKRKSVESSVSSDEEAGMSDLEYVGGRRRSPRLQEQEDQKNPSVRSKRRRKKYVFL